MTALNKRMNQHRSTIFHKENGLIAQHFNNGKCSIEDLCVQPIEQIYGDGRDPKVVKLRKLRELYWMKELRTVFPYGLNDRCNGVDWTKKDLTDITSSIFNKINETKTQRAC